MSSRSGHLKDEEIGAYGIPSLRAFFILFEVPNGGAQLCYYLGQYELSQLPEGKGLLVEEWEALSDAVSSS